MAIAEVTGSYADVARSPTAGVAEGDPQVRLDVHDASRLEWSVSVPLPESAPLVYAIDVEMELPSNTMARHKPWDQLQSFTRLDGGALLSYDADVITIDSLRRAAVALANEMARASEGFSRNCLVSASLFSRVANPELEETLGVWLDASVAMAAEAREKLVAPLASDAKELSRERELLDEYVSLRLLDMLAGAERGLDVLRESRAPQAESYRDVVARIESRIADALEREDGHRSQRGFLCPDPSSPEAMESYLERSSRLKKHFQEVLFLEPEVYEVAERLHHWVAGFVALIASTWAFVWQLALMNKGAASSRVGSGLIVVAAIAGAIYATKDRLKEMGRTWISGNVHRFYAQRVARYRAPARRLPGRDVVVTARESFNQRVLSRPDPLNAESGAKILHTQIRYTHRGKIAPKAALRSAGVRRIKHVFRYDFSPVFARLDDAIKKVPVLDRATHKVRFTAAPRCYRFPVRISVRCSGGTWEERAVVVLHKGGLDRLEREP